MRIQIYQKAGLAKSVKGKVVHLLENGTFTLLGSILFWAQFGQVLTIFSLFGYSKKNTFLHAIVFQNDSFFHQLTQKRTKYFPRIYSNCSEIIFLFIFELLLQNWNITI